MPPSCCEIVVFDMRTWLPEEALKGFREAGRRAKVATTPRRRAHRNRIPDSRIGLLLREAPGEQRGAECTGRAATEEAHSVNLPSWRRGPAV
jgi:hypothetical protein